MLNRLDAVYVDSNIVRTILFYFHFTFMIMTVLSHILKLYIFLSCHYFRRSRSRWNRRRISVRVCCLINSEKFSQDSTLTAVLPAKQFIW